MARKSQSADVSEIFEIKVRPQSSPTDAIEEYLKKLAQQEFLEAQLEKIREHKLKAQLERKKLEQELRKYEEEEVEEERGGASITPEMVQVAQMLASMPEDQRREVIKYLALIKSLEARNPSASAIAMATLLTGLQQQQQRGGDSGVWDIVRTVIDKIVEKVESGKTGSFSDELAKEYVNTLKQALLERKRPLDEFREWLSFFKEFGFAPFGAQYDPRVLVELEKLRLRRWLAMQKIKLKEKELRLREKELRQKEKQRRAMMKRLASAVISALMEPEEKELPPQHVQGAQLPQGYMEIECPKCRTKNVVPSDAETFTCVGCGTRFRIARLSEEEMRRLAQQQSAPSVSVNVGSGQGEEGGGHGAGSPPEAGSAHSAQHVGGRAQVVSY